MGIPFAYLSFSVKAIYPFTFIPWEIQCKKYTALNCLIRGGTVCTMVGDLRNQKQFSAWFSCRGLRMQHGCSKYASSLLQTLTLLTPGSLNHNDHWHIYYFSFLLCIHHFIFYPSFLVHFLIHAYLTAPQPQPKVILSKQRCFRSAKTKTS